MIFEIIYHYILFLIYIGLKIFLKVPFVKRILSFCIPYEKDIFRQPIEMIMNDGYTVEVHYIETEDGYINTAWRIGKAGVTPKQVVILQHGLFDSSITWFIDQKSILPYFLVDNGFDVWVTNNRGNRYSFQHKFLNQVQKNDKKKYWAFSVDEMAKYDLPAHVNYVKNATNRDKVHYIGHSQGTSQMFCQLIMNPSFKNNLESFIGLGSVVNINHASGALLLLMRSKLINLLYFLHSNTFLFFQSPQCTLLGEIVQEFPLFAWELIQTLIGFNRNIHINTKRLSVLASHDPCGTSIQNLMRWTQIRQKGKMSYFDYGPQENLKRYGQKDAPFYDTNLLKQFDTKKLLFRGQNDILASELDTVELSQMLDTEIITIDDYNHCDYCWASDAKITMFNRMLKFYNQQ